MIVQIIDIRSVSAGKVEYDAPVSIDGYRMAPSQIPFQGMKTPPRGIHVTGPLCVVERSEHDSQLGCVMGPNARLAIPKEIRLETLVSEALDHFAL